MNEQFDMGEEETQMPLGVGEESAEVPFSAEPKPKFNSATLLLIGVFAAGLALIYTLSLNTKPRTASAAQTATEAQVDSAITELLGKNSNTAEIKNLFRDADKLVAMFYKLQSGATDREELSANPFAKSSSSISPVQAILNVSNNDANNQELLRKAAEDFSQLKLETVMMGNRSVAMINHKAFTVGSKVSGFTVAKIEADKVVLRLGTVKFELKLEPQGLEGNN